MSSSSSCSSCSSAEQNRLPLGPLLGLGLAERQASRHTAVNVPHGRLVLRLLLLLQLPPPLLLLLLQLEVLGQEEGDGGTADAVVAVQRRHHQERSPDSHVTDRDCRVLHLWLLQESRALPRKWCLQSP